MYYLRIVLPISLLVLGACPSKENRCGPSTAVVERVVDGDTVLLDSGERVRYLMVDTPEVGDNLECFGNEASEFNRSLVEGKTIELRYDIECTDRFDRLLAYVTIDDREVNRLLVERGYACVLHIPPNGADRKDELESIEGIAKQQDKGLWGVCEDSPC